MSDRKTPYQRILEDIQEYCRKVRFRHTKGMWLYPKNRLNDNWNLGELWERVSAAEQLEYDVVLKADAEGLHVKYVKQLPRTPVGWD